MIPSYSFGLRRNDSMILYVASCIVASVALKKAKTQRKGNAKHTVLPATRLETYMDQLYYQEGYHEFTAK